MSKIFFDTDCELWYTMLPEMGCELFKMPYTIDGKEYCIGHFKKFAPHFGERTF